MPDILKPHPYQQECIESVEAMWGEGKTRVAAVLPTGGGKTLTFANLIKRYQERHPGGRALVLAHTNELVTQAAGEMRDCAPHIRTGIVQAGRNEITADVIIGSVPTLRNAKRRERIRKVGLIVVDECHHSTAQSYRDILEHFGAFDPDSPTPVAGFTATFARGDKAKLSDIWQDVAYRKDIIWMIREGYLLNVRGKRVEVPDFDMSKVKKRTGDYAASELGEAIEHSMAPEVVAKAYLEHSSDRSGLVFTPTVATAYLMSDALNAVGVRTEVVHGGLADRDRDDIVNRLKIGETQVVANCQALTEGFNAPIVSTVVIARPTRSAPLYQQMVGRGLRLYPGQTEALLLDVVGASKTHDLRSLVDLSSARPDTDCPDCTLLDLEEIAERGLYEKPIHSGPVDITEFDPLVKASRRTWLQTAGGTYFLSAGDEAYVFLCPSTAPIGTWDVAWCSKRATRDAATAGGFTEHIGVAMDYALAWGEEEAYARGGALMDRYTDKKRSWRRKPITEPQKNMARRLGIPFTDGMRADELSKRIDTHLASQRIDPIVSMIIAQRSGK